MSFDVYLVLRKRGALRPGRTQTACVPGHPLKGMLDLGGACRDSSVPALSMAGGGEVLQGLVYSGNDALRYGYARVCARLLVPGDCAR